MQRQFFTKIRRILPFATDSCATQPPVGGVFRGNPPYWKRKSPPDLGLKGESKMNLLLAQRFAQLRKEAGFSQEELAAKLGISRQAVSNGSGGNPPRIPTISSRWQSFTGFPWMHCFYRKTLPRCRKRPKRKMALMKKSLLIQSLTPLRRRRRPWKKRNRI